MLSVAAAADLPRKEPPPVEAAPIGKYPVGKYPVGKYPVGFTGRARGKAVEPIGREAGTMGEPLHWN